MTDNWKEILQDFTERCSPQGYGKFIGGIDQIAKELGAEENLGLPDAQATNESAETQDDEFDDAEDFADEDDEFDEDWDEGEDDDSDDDESKWDYFAADQYLILPHFMLLAAIHNRTMSDADFSAITADLKQMWRALIEKRDTTLLSEAHATEDYYFVNRLEDLRDRIECVVATMQMYATNRYSLDVDPNELVKRAVPLANSNPQKALELWGQAGAAALRGARYWSLWHLEDLDMPAQLWASETIALLGYFKAGDLYPLADVAEERVKFAERMAAYVPPKEDEDDDDDDDEESLSPEEQRLMDTLLDGEGELTDEQIAPFLSFTPPVMKCLKDALLSEEYQNADSVGEGYAPIHAARLLGQSQSLEAVEPLLMAIHRCDVMEILYSEAIYALENLGAIALESILESMRYSTSADFKLAIREVLGKTGKGDERAYHELEKYYQETTWKDDREMAASALGELGNARALPLLYQALTDRHISHQGIIEVVEAIIDIDPNYDRQKLQQLKSKAHQRYDSRFVNFDRYGKPRCRECGELMEKGFLGEWIHVEKPKPAPMIASPYKNVGRNDPCPCGSGKKYKHCHGSGKMTVN